MSATPRAPDAPEGIPADAYAAIGGKTTRLKPARRNDHDRRDDGRRRESPRPPITRQLPLRPDPRPA